MPILDNGRFCRSAAKIISSCLCQRTGVTIAAEKYRVGERVHQPDKTGKQPAPFQGITLLHGMSLLRDPLFNKGTAFSEDELKKRGHK